MGGQGTGSLLAAHMCTNRGVQVPGTTHEC